MADLAKNQFPFQPGDQIDAYKIIAPVGRGGMGVVYSAYEESLDRQVAIKMISRAEVIEQTPADQEILLRFLAEGRALAKFQHPNIVSIYGVGEFLGNPYLVMEYVEGISLKTALSQGVISFGDYLAIFKQILRGVSEAHRHSIIHRDLKPSNILIDKQKRVKIIDFGVAKNFSSDVALKTEVGNVLGTLNYMAPELIRGQLPSVKSDIYSLGAILYEMFVGNPLFYNLGALATIESIKTESVVFPERLLNLIPIDLQDLVLKMLDKDQDRRFENVDQLMEHLDKLQVLSLPEELKITREQNKTAENEDEIRRSLQAAGYLSREISLIINIAFFLHKEAARPLEDSTELLNLNEPILITKEELNKAIERLQFVKTSRSFRITHGESSESISRSKMDPRKYFSLFNLGAAIAIAFTLGITIFDFWSGGKNVQSVTSIPKGALIKTSAPPPAHTLAPPSPPQPERRPSSKLSEGALPDSGDCKQALRQYSETRGEGEEPQQRRMTLIAQALNYCAATDDRDLSLQSELRPLLFLGLKDRNRGYTREISQQLVKGGSILSTLKRLQETELSIQSLSKLRPRAIQILTEHFDELFYRQRFANGKFKNSKGEWMDQDPQGAESNSCAGHAAVIDQWPKGFLGEIEVCQPDLAGKNSCGVSSNWQLRLEYFGCLCKLAGRSYAPCAEEIERNSSEICGELNFVNCNDKLKELTAGSQ